MQFKREGGKSEYINNTAIYKLLIYYIHTKEGDEKTERELFSFHSCIITSYLQKKKGNKHKGGLCQKVSISQKTDSIPALGGSGHISGWVYQKGALLMACGKLPRRQEVQLAFPSLVSHRQGHSVGYTRGPNR